MKSSSLKVIIISAILPFMAFEGIQKGATYGEVNAQDSHDMEVVSIENPSKRFIFPDYQARGFIFPSGASMVVPISKQEYQQLKPGKRIVVFALPSSPNNFITASNLEALKPFIRLGRLVVTWHFPAAVFGLILIAFYIVQLKRESRS